MPSVCVSTCAAPARRVRALAVASLSDVAPMSVSV
jgi:hypothetical protein